MNSVDYDPTIASADRYGNVTARGQYREEKYKGFLLEIGVVFVKVWDSEDNFIGRFLSVEKARA